MKPIIYLDVDGVLNACSLEPTEWDDYQHVTALAAGNAWSICYSPTVVDFLVGVHDMDRAEIVWLTTWAEEANHDLFEKLGFWEPFRVAGAPDRHSWTWWKLGIVKAEWEAQRRPFIWIDDDLGDRDARKWLDTLPLGVTLAIQPQTAVGITKDDLVLIDYWLTDDD